MDYIGTGVEGDWKRSTQADFPVRGGLSVVSLPKGLPESSGVPQEVQHLVGCPGGGQNSQWHPVSIKKNVSSPFENAASQPQHSKGLRRCGGKGLRNRAGVRKRCPLSLPTFMPQRCPWI